MHNCPLQISSKYAIWMLINCIILPVWPKRYQISGVNSMTVMCTCTHLPLMILYHTMYNADIFFVYYRKARLVPDMGLNVNPPILLQRPFETNQK